MTGYTLKSLRAPYFEISCVILMLGFVSGCGIGGERETPFYFSMQSLGESIAGYWVSNGEMPVDSRGDRYALALLCKSGFLLGAAGGVEPFECSESEGRIINSKVRYANRHALLLRFAERDTVVLVGSRTCLSQTYIVDSNLDVYAVNGIIGLDSAEEILALEYMSCIQEVFQCELVTKAPRVVIDLIYKEIATENYLCAEPRPNCELRFKN